jgi:alanine racemase
MPEPTAAVIREGCAPGSSHRARAGRARMEVDLDAVRHNLGLTRRLAGGARVMAVVKGDAYGTGAGVVAPFLERCGADAFAVDSVAEGIALREAGVRRPIMVIDGDVPDNAALAIRHELTPGIPHETLLDAYQAAAASAGRTLPVWLLANLGFNRAGHRAPVRFLELAAAAAHRPNLAVQAVYAHMTNAEGRADISERQVEDFTALAGAVRGVLGRAIETSLFASHGVPRWASAVPTDWVRPGLLLYGEHVYDPRLVEPEALAAAAELRPAVALRARVIGVRDFDREEGVGYGQHHLAAPGQRLATLAFGFGGGYPYVAGTLWALARGRRAPLFGHPGMDAMQVDVTGIPGLDLYDWTTLLGSDGGQRLSVADLARAAGTTPYQLLSSLRCARAYRCSGG